MALTDTQLRNAKPAEKDYSITDGQGLSILITSKGAKGWRFRYRHLGKPKLMSFGTYPEVTLHVLNPIFRLM
ncbi:Arm DNA-binding domain-containing protein [Methylophilus flavus]|uniref:Arm DNA-binding domain-containing protein n=1 Tax=Methylophilus flavus TaxID=640084 RepID=A0ABW3PM33_9PROT